jgi:hypothetical protein
MMGWYVTIQEEMRDLGLKGNELLVFAFLNGYSQGGRGCYYGGLAHLQEVCGIASRHTAIDTLKSLVEKGLISKTETTVNGVKSISYSVRAEIAQGVQNLHKGCAEIAHNNKDININNNTLSIKTQGKFQKPSVEEIRQYCQERGNSVDPEQFYDFYEAKGWMVGKSHMKDWKASVRTWEKREKDVAPRKRDTRRETVLEHNLREIDRMYGTSYHEQAYGKKEAYDEQ